MKPDKKLKQLTVQKNKQLEEAVKDLQAATRADLNAGRGFEAASQVLGNGLQRA